MKFDGSSEMLKRIKLIIWDLDETLWEGTISEGSIKIINNNIQLIQSLSKRGIINSICSKNDWEPVHKELAQCGALEYFVFISVDWTAKGPRIRKIIEDMKLRTENVLFIDDNSINLKEAEFFCEKIMTCMPDMIPYLIRALEWIGKEDEELSRLKQYKMLEMKQIDEKRYDTNEEFLRNSHIVIQFKKPGKEFVNRIQELIERTNQLNFTKNRGTKNDLVNILSDSEVDAACIYIADDYGEYGMIGFYAVKNRELIHFLFSCRIMGMGIEQYVYAYLKYPVLKIVEPVASSVGKNAITPDYIKLGEVQDDGAVAFQMNALLKGPCDLEATAGYIERRGSIKTEFNFMASDGNQADFSNHSVTILNSLILSDKTKKYLSEKYPFLTLEAYRTSLFSEKYGVIAISLLMDATLGVYRHRKEGYFVSYGIFTKPITEERFWSEYIEKKVMTARSIFTRPQLESFSKEFELVEYSPITIVSNYRRILNAIWERNPSTHFIFITLSELPFLPAKKIQNEFPGKEMLHHQINYAMQEEFANEDRVEFLDVNAFIKTQGDYYDNINHYSKLVYYRIACELIRKIQMYEGVALNTVEEKIARKEHYRRILQKIYHQYVKGDWKNR